MGTAGRRAAAGWWRRPRCGTASRTASRTASGTGFRAGFGASTACPGPEVLAGYVERRLGVEARAAVGSHLLRCPRCRFVVGEALFFLAGAEAAPYREAHPAGRSDPGQRSDVAAGVEGATRDEPAAPPGDDPSGDRDGGA